MRSILVREFSPLKISTALFGTPRLFESSFINSAFAAPSTGGDDSLIFKRPSMIPTISLRELRGITFIVKITSFFVGVILF
jgi:hypothetical protein